MQRYDVFKYSIDKLNPTMLGYFLRPEEVSFERSSWLSTFILNKSIFLLQTLNIQTLLDPNLMYSCLAFYPIPNPELEGCIVTWDLKQSIRTVHTYYENVYADPRSVWHNFKWWRNFKKSGRYRKLWYAQKWQRTILLKAKAIYLR